MDKNSRGVLFGIDYYPEHWDHSLWETDAKRLEDMGIRAARMMEFAWAVLEPAEGKYDFSVFDEMIDIFARHQIRTVLGTPTPTFPAWLAEKDPEIFQVSLNGVQKIFGIRRHACFNSDTYLEASMKIVEAIAIHFGQNPNVIGWQIDNEIAHDGSDRCICDNCRKKWHRWLKAKYETIDTLNKTWGTVFWSTTYQHFKQIPLPREQSIQQNPSLVLDYDRFCSDSVVFYVNEQIKILRQHIHPTQWLSTNLYVAPHSAVIDMEKLVENMDMVGFDNYPVWGDMDEPSPYYFADYMLSYARGLKNTGKFIIFEQFTGMQAARSLGYLPPEQQGVLWTNQSIACGADQIYYFRWRTMPYGQEQLCSGILDYDNKNTARYEALAENIKTHQDVYEQFASQPFESQACLLYDKDNSRIAKEQYLSKGLYYSPAPFMQVGYDVEMARNFAPYALFNINVDVKSTRSVDLKQYKIISLPLYQMADPQFVQRLAVWVENGGTLILGWRSGTRDLQNWATPLGLPGPFAKLAGITIRRFEALNNTKVKIRIGWLPVPAEGEVWADLLQPLTAKPIAWYADKKKHYRGTPCVTVNKYGKGKVYYVGTSLGPTAIFLLYRRIFKDAGLSPKFHGLGIEVVRRKTIDGRSIDLILNHTDKPRRVRGVKVPSYGMKWIIRG